MEMEKKPLREYCQSLSRQVQRERLTWVDQWRQASRYLYPTRPRFYRTESNKGGRRNHYIIAVSYTHLTLPTILLV